MTNVCDVLLDRWNTKFNDVPRLKPIGAALNSAIKAQDDLRERANQASKDWVQSAPPALVNSDSAIVFPCA